jgi:hypothetical protein
VTLRGRITRLEARTPAAAATERDAAAFVDRLDRLGARVKAAGDFADTPDASPAERYCRALLRGDASTAAAIIRETLGGLS